MISYQKQSLRGFNFNGRRKNNAWLRAAAAEEGYSIGDIAIVFCSDEYLLGINKQFLKHDYYTDIITFDYCNGKTLSGDLLISIDSVRDNAEHFGTSFEQELRRVMIHGVLHLIGYDDHSDKDIAIMRSKEDYYLCKENTM